MNASQEAERLDERIDLDGDVIDHLVEGWNLGYLDDATFMARFTDLLATGHADAATLGRHYAGDRAPSSAHDQAFGNAVMSEQQPYLDALRSDLESGDLTADALRSRAESYLDRYIGTANEVWILLSPSEMTYEWILDDDAEHCADCPRIAAGSPYAAGDLPTLPGRNDTECLFNCRCYVVRSDGQESFAG